MSWFLHTRSAIEVRTASILVKFSRICMRRVGLHPISRFAALTNLIANFRAVSRSLVIVARSAASDGRYMACELCLSFRGKCGRDFPAKRFKDF
jgi:hypothetical protein